MSDEQDWLATQRPSRIREVQAGALAWTTVDLLDVESGEGTTLRGALEMFGVQVNRMPVGQCRQLVEVLQRGTASPYVILACHGDEGSIVLPDLVPELERYQPYHHRLTPADLRSFAHFDGAAVMATGCHTGHPDLVEAVLACGASAYVAPSNAPFGYASFFAPVLLFYELTQQRSLADAVDKLNQHDRELSAWTLHT